jgi:hypothetical protein
MPLTTDQYWDCSCDVNYIHPKGQAKCNFCGDEREDAPDSRIYEVNFLKLPLVEDCNLPTAIAKVLIDESHTNEDGIVNALRVANILMEKFNITEKICLSCGLPASLHPLYFCEMEFE